MATVGSSLSSALTVFKGSGTGSLSSLNRGGTYVANIAAYNGVSLTAPSLSQLVGLVSPAVSLPASMVATGAGAENGFVQAKVYLHSNGVYQVTKEDQPGSEETVASGTWLLTGSASDYEAMFDTTTLSATGSGASYTGTFDSYIGASGAVWSVQCNAPSGIHYAIAAGSISIRGNRPSDTRVLATCADVDIQADLDIV